VPWAGEFAGKYLISAIQACRMTDRRDLRPFVASVVADLISTQAEDGYLGPFPREERLLGHWDLWGHYHCLLALLMWHQDTGDEAALQCAMRAADLVCNTYLDTGRRVLDAGSPEMNMAVIHALGWLYRQTGNERYRRMMVEIAKDWEQAGDYYRAGVAGVPFFRCPRPRWESLHDLQGLVELYRITGEESYRQAFVSHWTSIMQYDRHNTGAFSTNEKAVGNPYSAGSIETCCTTAWMALTVDMLRLTGSPLAADELEWSTWNSMLGSQHPSGRWWTYDTPMDGVRPASAHTIVFQARVGTPELNCCSVNAPRGLGMLSEWAVMADDEGPIVNYYGPCGMELTLADGTPLAIEQQTEYPVQGRVRLVVHPGSAARGTGNPVGPGRTPDSSGAAVSGARGRARSIARPQWTAPETVAATAARGSGTRFDLRLRIPAWSHDTTAKLNRRRVQPVTPGTYLSLDRTWQDGDTVELGLDLALRCWSGELSVADKASLYRGPLLLAFDQRHNSVDCDAIPEIDWSTVGRAFLPATGARDGDRALQPMLLLPVPTADGREVTLCDFASAGAYGTQYRSWLPVTNTPPAWFYLTSPRDTAAVPAGPVLFQWTGFAGSAKLGRAFALEVATDPQFERIAVTAEGLTRPEHVVREGLLPHTTYYWRVTAHNAAGSTANLLGPRSFRLDPGLPNTVEEHLASVQLGPGDLVCASPLDGDGTPSFGHLEDAAGIGPAPDRNDREGGAVRFSGDGSMIRYRLPYFPEEEFTFLAWACPEGLPGNRLYQLFSAWAAGMDDPLRVCIHGEQLFARTEAGGAFGTPGVLVTSGEWFHVAAVKEGARLLLYVNGELRAEAAVPPAVHSSAQDFALGGNPHYTGESECFTGRLDDFALYARAFSGEDVAAAYRSTEPDG